MQPATYRGWGDHYLHFRYFTFHLLYTAWGNVYYNGRMYFLLCKARFTGLKIENIFWRRMLERCSSWVGGRQNGEIHFKYPHPEDWRSFRIIEKKHMFTRICRFDLTNERMAVLEFFKVPGWDSSSRRKAVQITFHFLEGDGHSSVQQSQSLYSIIRGCLKSVYLFIYWMLVLVSPALSLTAFHGLLLHRRPSHSLSLLFSITSNCCQELDRSVT